MPARRPPLPQPTFGFVVINTLMLWVAMGIASVALWPIYRSSQLILVVLVAVFVGSLIAILGALFRWSAPVSLAATIVAFLALGVPLAVPSEALFGILPTLGGLLDLVAGVALGWRQLLTISLPVGQYQALLVPFFTLILVVTVISLSVALRARRGGAAVLGPVVLFLTAIAFGSQTPILPVALSIGLLVIVLLWIVWRRWNSRRSAIQLLASRVRESAESPGEATADARFVGLRTLLAAVLILALAGGTAAASAAVLPPTDGRTVLRTTTTLPFEPRNYVSPLAGFRTYWEQPATDDVMMTVRGLPSGARIRIATLDTYDGVVYSVGSADVTSQSGSFTRVPYEFDQTGIMGKQVTLSFDLQNYRGVWLPTVGDFEKVTFSGPSASTLRDDFFYNNTSQTAAETAALHAGDQYTLSAVVPLQPSLARLASVTAGSASVPPITSLPAALTSVLNGYVAKASTPGAKLVAMITALRANGYVSHGVGSQEPASRSGHSLDRINELLTAKLMVGDAEQYAVTAALMARQLGFPARVVMGFVPETTGAGTSEVRGKDVSAWIEVDTAQYGWVTVDPNPPVRPIPIIPPKNPDQVVRPQTVVLPPESLPNPQDQQPAPDTQQHQVGAPNAFLIALLAVLQVSAWVLLVILILLSPFILIVAAKLRRRRLRRRAATALGRISGGWQEFQDAVVDHGFDPPPAATRSEVATTVGGAGTAVLAAVVDRASFAPGQPNEDEVDLVWRSVRELTGALNAGKTRWDRIKVRISLRSLRTQTASGYSVKLWFKR
jgi:hypothetical protein